MAPIWTLADNDQVAAPSLPSPEAASGPDGSLLEVPAPPVVIEGELPHVEPTPEDLMQHFRQSLVAPPSFLSSERRLADGSVEVTTRFGRFCAPAQPAQAVSGVGGDIRLMAPCVSF